MGSSKKTSAKAGKSVAKAHQRRADEQFQTPPLKTPSSRAKKTPQSQRWSFTSAPPTAADRSKNGRHEGRSLITWTRPRMAEKLLLHMQYECSRFKIELPWDTIAHRLHPGSSGGAIMQHLNRLRSTLVAEGHMVPPICQKPGSRVVVDQNIRGYVRRFPDTEDTVTTRPVTFQEPLDDRKFNLPDAVDRPDVPASVKRDNMGGGGSARKSAAIKTPVIKKEPSPDPDSMRPDDTYDVTTYGHAARDVATPRRSQRAARKPASYAIPDDDNDYSSQYYADEGDAQDQDEENYQVKDDDDVNGGSQPAQGQQVDYDEVDNQSMVPSQGSVQTTAGRGNIHTRRPVHAESPRNTHATFHTRPQNGYANQINGYYHQNMVTAVNDPSLYHRHHVHSQNPEDVAKEGWIIAEDDEGALTPPTSQTHHSAGYIGVNADAHAFHQYHNAVNSHRQPIPVVNVNHENYDDDGIPPEGIPIYDDEDDEVVEEVEEDDYYGGQDPRAYDA